MGTEIVSTLQLKLTYLDTQNRTAWVEPYYLQNNLVPGEEQIINVPLSKPVAGPEVPMRRLTVNGNQRTINAPPFMPTGIKRPGDEGQILIDYDAMIYRKCNE